jgi:hypothetical protein
VSIFGKGNPYYEGERKRRGRGNKYERKMTREKKESKRRVRG